MGETVRWTSGSRAIGTGTDIEYVHPADAQPTMLHLVSLDGTFATTAKVTVYVGVANQLLPLEAGATVQTTVPYGLNPSFLLMPGQKVQFHIQNATAGDVATAGVFGH